MVSTANQVSLGQVVVDAKSNEITAIPKLLEILELSGALVTIDAMGCQTEIAQQIVDADADYCLAAKVNQPTLHQGIVDFFDDHLGGRLCPHAGAPPSNEGEGARPRGAAFLHDLSGTPRLAGPRALGPA